MVTPEELAKENLEELMVFLSEESELSPEDIMNEVCLLVENYQSELNLIAEEKEKDILIDLAEEHIVDDSTQATENNPIDVFEKLSKTTLNRGFLLGKATDLYYKKNHLDADSFSSLSAADKVVHRKAITALFNELVGKEANKSGKTSRYSGAIKRNKTSAKLLDEKTDVEIDYYKDKIKEARRAMRLLKAEIAQIEIQNEKVDGKVSGIVLSRNLNRIDELKDELAEHDKNVKYFQTKL